MYGKYHNDINHGNKKGVSMKDKNELREYIIMAYNEIKDQVSAEDSWLFREEVQNKTD